MSRELFTKTLNRRFLAGIAAVVAFAATAAAQTVVVGTGNPDIDVPAVQAAVDQGGSVVLMGHFSFDRPPTIPMASGDMATVLVSKAVVISGAREEDGEMTSVEAGTHPFYVEAPGTPVTIQELRFVQPKVDAINVYAVSGLVIASCRIEGADFIGIELDTSFNIPSPTAPGKPENISGTILIVNNDIEMVGETRSTNGILMWSAGQSPDKEVDIYITGNNVRGATEPAINLRHLSGRTYVERNVLTTGSVAGPAAGPQVIRAVNSGSYLIAHNSIFCLWAQGMGIGVYSQFAAWPIVGAIVVDNDVTMSPPEGTLFGADSAGIAVRGFAQGNVVLNNRIRGRARAALSVDVFRFGIPENTRFVLNDLEGFHSSLADVFVGAGVTNTLIVGRHLSVEDHGIGTTIVTLPLGDD